MLIIFSGYFRLISLFYACFFDVPKTRGTLPSAGVCTLTRPRSRKNLISTNFLHFVGKHVEAKIKLIKRNSSVISRNLLQMTCSELNRDLYSCSNWWEEEKPRKRVFNKLSSLKNLSIFLLSSTIFSISASSHFYSLLVYPVSMELQ